MRYALLKCRLYLQVGRWPTENIIKLWSMYQRAFYGVKMGNASAMSLRLPLCRSFGVRKARYWLIDLPASRDMPVQRKNIYTVNYSFGSGASSYSSGAAFLIESNVQFLRWPAPISTSYGRELHEIQVACMMGLVDSATSEGISARTIPCPFRRSDVCLCVVLP